MKNLQFFGITNSIIPFFVSLIFLILFSSTTLYGILLEVGVGKTYSSVANAAGDAQPGDTILVFAGNYSGSNFIYDLHGTSDNYIYILGEPGEEVVFHGGSLGMQFSKVSYIHIENFHFTAHTGNSLNIDDGGIDELLKSRFITISNCHFYEMGAQGNNDFLKMSGVDSFEVKGCTFIDGADGGSGIDMVGCHAGYIWGNSFENMGSNSIQAKGGTQYIDISRNYFKNGGQRSLNLGGSTGLEFFRPQDATFEAADLNVYANVFIGSTAPIAYVGCVRVQVVNNTIVNPGNWVIRILQETVDPERFEECGENSFINNIVYFDNSISTFVNIGPDTAPNTFVFSNNLWYNHEDPNDSSPNLPVPETDAIIGEDPLFENFDEEDFILRSGSPAINTGTITNFELDFNGNEVPVGGFIDIGALEFLGFLPVEFIGPELEFRDNIVHIKWRTASEYNNDYFIVERSNDGLAWSVIDQIHGNGSTNTLHFYSSKDDEPDSGNMLYRVKQTDFDGTFSYSKIVSIEIPSNKNLKIYPNPFTNKINIEGTIIDTSEINLYDTGGKLMQLNITQSGNLIEINLLEENLASGQYILEANFGTFNLIKL